MTEQEREWFDKLREKRLKAWDVLSDMEYVGAFDGLVNKYSDTAHFIFELLQNADDAGASDVEIRLERRRMTFAHNGSERFTVTDVASTAEDRERGKLGHINSITAINYSSKVQLEHELAQNKIGKFGIGFKAIFQYTTTPYIYDDGICFKIEHFIVPSLLGDTSLAQRGKTVFVLPFDQEETKDRAYAEIERKLVGLDNPQLYLHNIKNIHWETETAEGTFFLKLLKEYNFSDINIYAERLALSGKAGTSSEAIKISRIVEIDRNGLFPIAITYYLKGDGAIDTTKERRLNCFFPTNESIGTCYGIHAPFLLTESRQTLRGGEPINKRLFEGIAELAADSLIALRKISEAEQYPLLDDDIKKLADVSVTDLSNWDTLMGKELFKEAYSRVFRSEALFLSSQGQYMKADETCWANKDLRDLLSPEQLYSLTQRKDFALCLCSNYLADVKGLGIVELSATSFSEKLSPSFLLSQSDEWLDRLYAFANRNENKAKGEGNGKSGDFHYCPIFKTDANTFAPAFDKKDSKPILYKHTAGVTSAHMAINQDLLQRSAGLRDLTETFGIREANIIDYIRMRLKEKQESWPQEEANSFWTVVINYWANCNEEEKRFLHKELNERLLVKSDIVGSNQHCGFAKLSDVYKDTEGIRAYFLRAANAYWWYLNTTTYADSSKEKKWREALQQHLFDESYYESVKGEVGDKYDDFIEWLGIKEYPEEMQFEKDYRTYHTIDSLSRVVHYLSNVEIETEEPKGEAKRLCLYLWRILSFYVNEIANYVIGDYPDLKNSSYKKCDNLRDFLREKKWMFIDNERTCPKETCQEDLFRNGYEGKALMEQLGIEKRKETNYSVEAILQKLPSELRDRLSPEDINKVLKAINTNELKTVNTLYDEESDDVIESNASRTIEELSKEEMAMHTPRYTYKWFKILIDLEAEACGQPDEDKKRRALKVNFASVVFPHEEDIIRLECASRYVPVSIEEIDNLEVAFCMLDGSQVKIKFDAVSVKDSVLTLKVKQQQKHEIEELRRNAKRISHAEINCEQPIDLLNSWKRLISNLPFGDNYSLKDNLRYDVQFIFGPPGTGKTYQLAQRIISLMNSGKAQRILVLTPTNKACDVLTEKIMDFAPCESSWLSRFVKTLSDRIENEGVVLYHDSTINEQICLVTTIARYAYDSCNEGLLRDMDWDIVVIDEASMIPLYEMIPPLYNNKLHQIIIAGDPFQIQPIVSERQWKDENIYTMLELNNFSEPTTNPQGFQVETLNEQWRSIPEIGELYSRYSYDGLLTHHRKNAERLQINMGLDAQPLNIITYPVSKESTFAPQRIKGSNIQVYSVIFTVELLRHITNAIANTIGNQDVSIGVVSPYAAEVQAISKVYEQLGEHYDNVHVTFGTAHGFQGDECNVIIAVMNPPASGLIKNARKTFINNQNIINVSVSRATDYLFVVMPNSDYEHSDKLIELNRLCTIMRRLSCKQFTHDDIERAIYGHKGVIEENTFVTSHQMTNVYTDFSKKYEVRIDETSMDIQVNGK